MKQFIMPVLAALVLAASCSNEKKNDKEEKKDNAMMMNESKQERNKKVIMANMEAAGKADVDAMLKDAASSFTEYTDGTIPPITNADTLKGLLKMMFASLENYKPSNTMLFADGDYVLAYATWTGTFKNDLMGIKATGKMVSFPDVDIFKLNEEGKIVEHHSVQNLGAVLMAGSMMK